MDSVASSRFAKILGHLSAGCDPLAALSLSEVAGGQDRLKAFDEVFAKLKADLVEELHSVYGMPADSIKYFDKLLQYTVPGGKMNRGLSVIDTYQVLLGRALTDQELLRSSVLGWTVEWLQAFFLVADDLMDGSHTRRGNPCWFRLPDVGLNAANDSLILEACLYKVLKRYFRQDPFYVSLFELMQEVTYKTELGQMLDLRTAVPGKVDFSNYNMDTYARIVKFKTAYYSFYLPVAQALLLAGYDGNQAAFDTALAVLLPMGEYFQIQDDFLDCYGDAKVIGKIGTDIQDNKCGWLIVQALQRASPAQRKILEDNYAKDDAACVARVKAVYEQLNLREVFARYEDDAFVKLQALISKSTAVPPTVFKMFLDKIFKRKL
jgi:farnesyl diphosphate synthase